MTEVLRIFKELYSPKEEYCVICFRSGKERRMVSKNTLKRFLKSINFSYSFDEDFQRVCFVCGRAVSGAWRVRRALAVSAAVHRALARLPTHTHTAEEDIFSQLLGEKPVTGAMAHAHEWSSFVLATRERTRLLQTEVLIVNSLEQSSSPPPPETESPAPAAGACADVYVVPDAAPPGEPAATASRMTHDVSPEPEIYMESIQIDDETDPIEIKDDPEDPPGGPATPSPPGAPLVPPIGGPLVPPLVGGPLLPPLVGGLIVPPPVGAPIIEALTPKSYLLHSIVEKDGIITVPSLGAQIVNGQLVTIDKTNIMIHTPKIALHNGFNFNFITEPSEVSKVLKDMSVANVDNVAILSDKTSANLNMSVNLGNNVQIMNNTIANVMGNDIQMNKLVNNVQIMNNTIANMGSDIQMNKLVNNVQIMNNTLTNTSKSNINMNNNNESSNTIQISNNAGKIIVKQPSSINNSILSSSNFNVPIYKQNCLMTDKPSDEPPQIIIDDENDIVRKRQKIDNQSETAKVDGKSKRKETDWEDKIPMDVISFMDATDPLAAPQPSPQGGPLALISNVHTITDSENIHSTNTNTDTSKSVQLNVQSPKKYVQSPITNAQLAITNVQSTITNTQSGVTNVQPVINVLPTITNVQSGISNVQSTKINVQSAIANVQSAKVKIMPGTTDIQPAVTVLPVNTVKPANNGPVYRNFRPMYRVVQPIKRNVQQTNSNVQPATNNLQLAKTIVELTKTFMQPSKLNEEPIKPNVQQTKLSVQPTKLNEQTTKPNVQPTTLNEQITKPNVQSSKPNVQPTKPNVQPDKSRPVYKDIRPVPRGARPKMKLVSKSSASETNCHQNVYFTDSSVTAVKQNAALSACKEVLKSPSRKGTGAALSDVIDLC